MLSMIQCRVPNLQIDLKILLVISIEMTQYLWMMFVTKDATRFGSASRGLCGDSLMIRFLGRENP